VTTFTMTGISWSYDESDNAVYEGSVVFKTITTDDYTSTYSVLATGNGDLPTVAFSTVTGQSYLTEIDGVALGFSTEAYVGALTLFGKTSYIMNFFDPNTGIENVFVVGGAALSISSQSDLDALMAAVEASGTLSAISSGPFAPGAVLDYNNIAIGTITENDSITGTNLTDVFSTGAGKDTVFGGDGEDVISGGAQSDKLYGDDDADDLYGGLGNDALYGGAANDTMYGDEGNDKLYGGADSDSFYGGVGLDKLFGGTENDSLYGGENNDKIYGQDGADKLYGGDDKDVLFGGAGTDTLVGDDGGDKLFGNGAVDVLYGGSGKDTLYGRRRRPRCFVWRQPQ